MDDNDRDRRADKTRESERRWDELFARSPELLERLAAEAMAEYDAGLTQPIEIDSPCEDR
jgi:hypothetical protein